MKLGDAPYVHYVYGLTHTPDFKIVGWAYWSDEQEAGHRQLLEKPTADLLDDQIPFFDERGLRMIAGRSRSCALQSMAGSRLGSERAFKACLRR